jgi:mRNA interferase RelE/StbE
MSYSVLLEREAEKEVRSLPSQILHRLDRHLLALSNDPWPRGALKLKGKAGEGWRIKVGDYRILYVVEKEQQVVKVYRIKHRRDVYR